MRPNFTLKLPSLFGAVWPLLPVRLTQSRKIVCVWERKVKPAFSSNGILVTGPVGSGPVAKRRWSNVKSSAFGNEKQHLHFFRTGKSHGRSVGRSRKSELKLELVATCGRNYYYK